MRCVVSETGVSDDAAFGSRASVSSMAVVAGSISPDMRPLESPSTRKATLLLPGTAPFPSQHHVLFVLAENVAECIGDFAQRGECLHGVEDEGDEVLLLVPGRAPERVQRARHWGCGAFGPQLLELLALRPLHLFIHAQEVLRRWLVLGEGI